MFCFQCGKSIPSESIFCLYCGAKQTAVHIESQSSPITSTEEPSSFGFYIIDPDNRLMGSKNKKWDPSIPQWVQQKTFSLNGSVLVWDFETHQTESLSASWVISILDTCAHTDQWKTDGIPIIETRFRIPESPRKKKDSAKTKQPPIEELREDIELFRIRGKDAEQFLHGLKEKRSLFESIHAHNQRVLDQARAMYWKFGFDRVHQDQESKVDWAKLHLSWKHEGEFHWSCNQDDLNGAVSFGDPFSSVEKSPFGSRRVKASQSISAESDPIKELIDNHLLWCAVIRSVERNHFDCRRFGELQEALEWTEQHILETPRQPISPALDPNDEPMPFVLTDEYRQKLAPYWIDPSALDAELLTYQAIIMIQSKPEREEPFTFLSGKTIMTNQQYYSPARLASMLGLDDSSISFEFIVPDSELYRATSLTRFYSVEDAIDQAQKLWSKSKILPLFQSGTILLARYGYREVETGYEHFLGECSSDSESREKSESREDYLSHRALRYTLVNALDVDGYRSLLGISNKYFSNEDLLRMMHERRADCKLVPLKARTESLKWLDENPAPLPTPNLYRKNKK